MTQHHLTRRQFAQAGAASLGALAMSGADALAQQNKKNRREQGFIDAHVHVWTPDVNRYPLAAGYKKEGMKPASFTPEELFQHARPNDVTRITLIQMSFYGFDNSYMLDAMKRHPGVFSGVAVIDENDRPAERMVELQKQGVRGFRIQPRDRKPDQWLAGEGMQAMWREGGETGLNMCCLIDPVFLPSVDRMCRERPDTPVVIDHFARVGIDGTIRKEDLDNLCGLAKHKNVTVKVSAFYALGKKQPPYVDLIPMIRRVLDAYGPERLMWASDCPFQVEPPHTYQPSLDLIRLRCDFLSDSDREQLFRKTAERVFFS
jgi:predicted TIM-barrel fold metal-dependent hydrolase